MWSPGSVETKGNSLHAEVWCRRRGHLSCLVCFTGLQERVRRFRDLGGEVVFMQEQNVSAAQILDSVARSFVAYDSSEYMLEVTAPVLSVITRRFFRFGCCVDKQPTASRIES